MRKALLVGAATLAVATAAHAETYAIQAGRLIVDAAQPARGNSTVIVENGRISRIDSGFTDEELKWLDRHVRNHTVNRFGPVREVDKSLVLEVAFDSIHRSTRHKSGLAMRFPRISRIRTDKPANEADRIATLLALAT